MAHDEFMPIYFLALKTWMREEDFKNEYARLGLKFLARLAVSNGLTNQENQIMKSVSEWLLEFTSLKVTIRRFIHYFIQYLVKYAAVLRVEVEFDGFVAYAMDSMRDGKGEVREQAALILLHFQEDADIRQTLLFHLNGDPNSTVRRAIVKSIRFMDETVPEILKRLLDVNENVRAELYSELVERDVRTLTIAQRHWILDHGFREQSAKVQSVIVNQLISSWLEMYNNKYLALLAAIKYDANADDIKKFMRNAQYILFNLFEGLMM